MSHDLPVRREHTEREHTELGGSRVRTPDLNWPKDVPCHRTSCSGCKLGDLGGVAPLAAWGLTGHH